MFINVLAKETSDGLWVDHEWIIEFNGLTVVSIWLESIGYLSQEVMPKDWRFAIDSSGELVFGSPNYVVKGTLIENSSTVVGGTP